MNTAVWVETAGAGLRAAHTPALQRPLAHCVLALHGSLSARLCGVGVIVNVGVTVGGGVTVEVGVAVGVRVLVAVAVTVLVAVGVAVLVGVAVGCTHVPGQTISAAPPSPPPSHVRQEAAPPSPPPSEPRQGEQPLGLLGSQTRPGSQDGSGERQHGPPEKPQTVPSARTLPRPAASSSTTSTARPIRFMAAVYEKR